MPPAEVLDFKRRRRDELQALREEIDSLAAAVDRAEDRAVALAEQAARVDKACADAIKVGSEWQFPVRLANLKSSYELRPIATLAGALSGGWGSGAIGLPVSASVLGALAGAALATAPALKLSFDGFDWHGLRPRQWPYRYVYRFHREVF